MCVAVRQDPARSQHLVREALHAFMGLGGVRIESNLLVTADGRCGRLMPCSVAYWPALPAMAFWSWVDIRLVQDSTGVEQVDLSGVRPAIAIKSLCQLNSLFLSVCGCGSVSWHTH